MSSPDKPKTEWLNPVRTLEPANLVKTKIFTQKKAIKSQGRRAPQKIIAWTPKNCHRKNCPESGLHAVCNLRPANPDVKDGVCCPAPQLPIKKPMSKFVKMYSQETKACRVSKLRLQDFRNCCRGLHATSRACCCAGIHVRPARQPKPINNLMMNLQQKAH